MAARSGVIDTSASKGIADLHAEVLSNDSVAAPAHEVVQDSDLIADPSIHADAVPEHSGDTAATSTGDATAEDTGHVHADLAYADTDHGYADVDHAYADHGVADVDHAYADHAFADAAVPDSAFTDHSMLMADAGTPHSLGADAAKGQDDGHNAAAWWWVGGAALAGGGIGYWIGDEHNDDSSSHSSSAAAADVHVVVERGDASDGAVVDTVFIDDNANGVHDSTELTAADFGHGGNADLAANSVTIHFNDVPLEALNLTGFGADDKIEFHVEAMINNHVFSNAGTGSVIGQHLVNLEITSYPDAWYQLASTDGGNGAWIGIHQHSTSQTDFNGHTVSGAGVLMIESMQSSIFVANGSYSTTSGAIAYWTDAGNALNDNADLFPNFAGYTGGNTATVLANLNNNNEGGVIDFIWPSGAPVIPV